jgi:hypothetical protein
MGAITDMASEVAGTALLGIEQLLSGDFSGYMKTAEAGRAQVGEFFNAQNYAYANEAPGRGMAGSEMGEQTQLLRDIRDSLKGSR